MAADLAGGQLGLVAVGAALAWLAWRVDGLVRAQLAQQAERQARELAIREREVALAERRQSANEEMPEMPLDLVMRCNGETEVWAREQLRSLVQQLWAKHRTWDGVRSEIAALDAASVALEMGWSQTKAVS